MPITKHTLLLRKKHINSKISRNIILFELSSLLWNKFKKTVFSLL